MTFLSSDVACNLKMALLHASQDPGAKKGGLDRTVRGGTSEVSIFFCGTNFEAKGGRGLPISGCLCVS